MTVFKAFMNSETLPANLSLLWLLTMCRYSSQMSMVNPIYITGLSSPYKKDSKLKQSLFGMGYYIVHKACLKASISKLR